MSTERQLDVRVSGRLPKRRRVRAACACSSAPGNTAAVAPPVVHSVCIFESHSRSSL
ncbi:MAG: hypothetical protein ACRD1M_00755 [Terriglobales bacterium]